MAYSITITNTNGAKVRFYGGEVSNCNYSIRTKIFKESLPDDDGGDAIMINLGRDNVLSFPFKLTNTTSTSESIDTTTNIYTVSAKINYILNTFITSGIEDFYTINVLSNDLTLTSLKGILEDFSINITSQNPTTLSGNMSFSLGGGSQ